MSFKNYRTEKPPEEGWYVWRVNHRHIKNLTIEFLSKYRTRGAGFETVLSPQFDYWDGYRILLPDGNIEWDHIECEPKKHSNKVI